MSAQHPGSGRAMLQLHPANHPGIRRAASELYPSIFARTSYVTPGKFPEMSGQLAQTSRTMSVACPRNVRKRDHLISASVVGPCPYPVCDYDRSLFVSANNPRSRPVRK